jgi:hypothetical protein
VGYFILDRTWVIYRINLTGGRLLGLERGQLLGQSFGLFISPADFNTFYFQNFY